MIDAPTRTTSAASVAYATEESGSDAKIGRASVFESSVSPISAAARGRPIKARFTASVRSGRVFSAVSIGLDASHGRRASWSQRRRS